MYLCPWAAGIEVFLKNGDRLQGELMVESDDHLTIAHPILGEIEIAKSDLAEVPPMPSGPATAVVTEAKPKPTPEPAAAPGEEREMPQSKKEADPEVPQIPEVLRKLPAGLVQVFQEMNSRIGFSLSDKSSRRDRTDLRFFYNSKWKNGNSEFVFDTDYRYIEVNDETSDDRYTANFRFRRQKDKHFFLQTTTFFRRDPIREIEYWLEQGIGMGWKNKVSPDFEYSVGAEGSVKYEEFSPNANGIGGYSYLSTLFQDSVYHLGKNYQIVQEAESYIAPDNSENWGYRFEVKLDGKITSGVSVRLGYEYNYENIVARNVPNVETLFSSSLLYTF